MGATPGSAGPPPGNTTVAPTAAQFLLDFPAYDVPGNPVYSAASIQFWLNWGALLLNAPRFGASYYYCLELFVAHNLSLVAWDTQGSGSGAIPGIAKGPIAGAAAGNVSVSYNTAAVLELDAGHWNYTAWGQILIRYIRMAGAGPIYVGAGSARGGNAVSGGGWFTFANSETAFNGPPVFNFPNMSGSG